MELIRGAHFDDVGVRFDFGHAHMENSVSQWPSKFCATTFARPTFTITTVRKTRTCGLGQGTINWKEAVELLRSAPQTPPLLLEIGEDESEPAGKLQETFEKLETA